MPCYSPLEGWRKLYGGFTLRKRESNGNRLTVPCGQCRGCRLEYSRQWAIRCMHEASLHTENSFITLTYNNQNLPHTGSLDKAHFQKFMKRLRRSHPAKKIRYYHCGEYGSKLGRPHYHACLFGHDFADKKLHTNQNGNDLYSSQELTHVWGKGYCLIGEVNFQSAAYVARYIMKKVTGEKAHDHYQKIDTITGEIYNLQPEYTTMSRKPGIAKEWFDKYKKDVYPHDEVIVKGRRTKPPRYYDIQYEITDPKEFEKIKTKRRKAAQKRKNDNTPERLATKQRVKLAQISQLKRSYEDKIE